MFDEDEERLKFYLFTIPIAVVLGINIIVFFWSGYLVDLTPYIDLGIVDVNKAARAVMMIIINTFFFIFTGIISWIIPKFNVINLDNSFEIERFKIGIIIVFILLNGFTVFSCLLAFSDIVNLLMDSGITLGKFLYFWLSNI